MFEEIIQEWQGCLRDVLRRA